VAGRARFGEGGEDDRLGEPTAPRLLERADVLDLSDFPVGEQASVNRSIARTQANGPV